MAMAQFSEMEDRYLTFLCDGQLFAIPIAEVEQIISMQKIIPVPEYPSFAKGIIHLRGAVIPAVDMRLRMNRPECTYNERSCIIIVRIGEQLMGLITDGVREVADFPLQDLMPPPRLAGNGSENYIIGIAEKDDAVILLLDVQQLFDKEELKLFMSTNQNLVTE